LSVAAGLLGVCVPGSGARIMAFIGGPSTEGPGSVSHFCNNYHIFFFFFVDVVHVQPSVFWSCHSDKDRNMPMTPPLLNPRKIIQHFLACCGVFPTPLLNSARFLASSCELIATG
jgi:hypothetical protein